MAYRQTPSWCNAIPLSTRPATQRMQPDDSFCFGRLGFFLGFLTEDRYTKIKAYVAQCYLRQPFVVLLLWRPACALQFSRSRCTWIR